MDEYSVVGSPANAQANPNAEPHEEIDARSGEDRRRPTDRRRGNYRLQALNARRDGDDTDRRRRDRRARSGMSWLSVLWRWAKN